MDSALDLLIVEDMNSARSSIEDLAEFMSSTTVKEKGKKNRNCSEISRL